MQYKYLLLAALASLVGAQNAFTLSGVSSITAGTPFNITWTPSPGTTSVTLLLRQGDSKNLKTVSTIASSLPNTGSYSWTPPLALAPGVNYAFEIIDCSNAAIFDYTSQFSIVSSTSAGNSTAGAAAGNASCSDMGTSTAGPVAVPTTGYSNSTVAAATMGAGQAATSGAAASGGVVGGSGGNGANGGSTQTAGNAGMTGTSAGGATAATGGAALTRVKAFGVVFGFVEMLVAAL